MFAATGRVRSGKSNTVTCIGEEMSLNRPLRARDITFWPPDYIADLQRKSFGDFAQFDEPAAEWNNRDFMSAKNKMLNATHVIFGSIGITVGWALPSLGNIDKGARELVTYIFEMNGRGNRGRARFYETWMNRFSGKVGRKRLGSIWFGRAWQGRPEEAKEYGEIKRQYQDEHFSKSLHEFAEDDDQYQDKAAELSKKKDEAVKAILGNLTSYTNSRGHVSAEAFENEFRLPHRAALDVARRVNAVLDGKVEK